MSNKNPISTLKLFFCIVFLKIIHLNDFAALLSYPVVSTLRPQEKKALRNSCIFTNHSQPLNDIKNNLYF